jgi:hypothetical protein
MKMPSISWIATVISLLLVFLVGLNLGLHGVISIHAKQEQSKASDFKLPEEEIPPATNLETSQYPEPRKQPLQENKVRNNIKPFIPKTTPPVATTAVEPKKEEQLKYHEKVVIREETLDLKFKRLEDSILKASAVVEIPSTAKDKYKQTPIVLLTCNRPSLLRETLDSLFKVHGVRKDHILVVQDGNMQEVASVVRDAGITLLQNLNGLRLRGGAGSDGASRIAQHYKFALSAAFDKFQDAAALIIVEDDLLFAPDFYEYLIGMAPVTDLDPTTFVISAWNDNGFKGKVQDPHAIRRTEFFPGLGWILPRKLYKQELERKWPKEHWDHWLRSPETHQNRECVYPQVIIFSLFFLNC